MVTLDSFSNHTGNAYAHVEICRLCGNHNFLVARDTKSTRRCKCGHEWLPLTDTSGYEEIIRFLKDKIQDKDKIITMLENKIIDLEYIIRKE